MMLSHALTDVQHRVAYPDIGIPPQVDTFTLSISAAWLNKQTVKALQNPNASNAQIQTWKDWSWNAFAPQRMTLDALMSHILAGRAWMPAAAKKRKHFLSAQALALDFDNDAAGSLPVSVEALKQHPFVGKYAAFIYATPTSTPDRPKSRALFILDEVINTAQGYRAAAIALMDLCADLHPDPACKDTARLFFGSTNAEHWAQAAVMPLGILREHTRGMAQAEQHPAYTGPSISQRISGPNASHAQKRKHAYAVKALVNNAATIASTPQNAGRFGGRNKAFHTLLCETLNLAYTLSGTIHEIEIIDTLSRAAAASGLPDSEIKAVVESALKYPREILRSAARINFDEATPPDRAPMNMQRRAAEKVVHAYFSPIGEYLDLDEDMPPAYFDGLAYEDAPACDDFAEFAEPSTRTRDAEELGKSSGKARVFCAIFSEAQAAAPRPDTLNEYPPALPDSWMFALEDVRGGQVAGLLNALYSLLHQGRLDAWADSETIRQALTDAGYTFDANMLSKGLSAAVKAQFIEAASAKAIFPKVQHIEIDIERESSVCCTLGKTKNARRFYRVLPFEALGKQIMARVFEALIDDFYPHETEAYDAALAELVTLEDIRSILGTLKARRLNSLSAPSVWAVVPYGLKAAAKHKGDIEAAQENVRRRAAFFAAIRCIPAPATRNGLIALGLDAQAAETAAAKMNQVSSQVDTHGLISLKWALMLASYKHRMAAFDDMETTAFSEARLEAKAQMDALRRARVMPHDNRPMTGKAQAERLGVDNRASAVRASKRLGLRREERSERRPLIVKRRGDAPILIEDIRAAAWAAVSKGEFPTQIVSFDEHGKLFDSAAIEGLEDLRLGVAFAVQVQMASIMHVEAMPQRAERVKADASEDAAQDAQAAAPDGSRDNAPRRVHRTRLYTPQWVLHNMIAPRIPQRDTSEGKRWIHPETGEAFEDVCSMLYALIDKTPPQVSAQATEAVTA